MSIAHDDPRLTAYALGELSPEELLEFRGELQNDLRAREEVEAIREAGAWLEAELARSEAPALPAERRAQILEAAKAAKRDEPAPAQTPKSRRRRWATAMVWPALAAVIVLATWPRDADQGQQEPQLQARKSKHALELSLPATPEQGSDGPRAQAAVPAPKPVEGLGLHGVGAIPLESAPHALAERAAAGRPRVDPPPRILPEPSREQWNGLLDRAEAPSGESYDGAIDNPFIAVASDPRSTFSIDVDTASYALVRRFLDSGSLPPRDAVRIEELLNYFSYRYPQPSGDAPVSIVTSLARAPWNPAHYLARVAVQARHVEARARPAANLVFLIDVSGSMESENKLGLVKYGLRQLVSTLRAQDRVSIVTYAGNSGLALPPTSGEHRETILNAIDQLEAGGSTNGGAGIGLAYSLARQNFARGKVNRVLLATDGDFNVGVTSQEELVELIQREARSGVFLSVLGFGDGNYKDATLEKLADKGNGNYAYIDERAEAQKVLLEQATGTLVTVAKDVKLQLEFNPTEVAAFRLIGYENRQLQHRDFNDDGKDAGELGADGGVTALYELIPAALGASSAATSAGTPRTPRDTLKFQAAPPSARASAFAGQLLNVKLRYQPPSGGPSQLLEQTLRTPVQALDPDFRFAAAVAEFGMLLRQSPHRGQASYAGVLKLAETALGDGRDRKSREQFLQLVRRARKLSPDAD